MIKALVFDLDDTLYDLEVPFRRTYDIVFAAQYHLPVGKVFLSMREHNNEVYDLTQTGKMSDEELYVYRMTEAMKDFGVAISRDEALHFQDVYHKFQHDLALTDNMKDFLAFASKRKLTLGIISNGPSVHQRDKMRSLGVTRWIPVENIIVSGDTGVMKPDPAIFKLAENKLGLSPKNSWYVGDSFDRDVEGAAAAGWHTIWINRRGYRKPKGAAVTPDHTAESEEELTALLTTMIRNLPLRVS